MRLHEDVLKEFEKMIILFLCPHRAWMENFLRINNLATSRNDRRFRFVYDAEVIRGYRKVLVIKLCSFSLLDINQRRAYDWMVHNRPDVYEILELDDNKHLERLVVNKDSSREYRIFAAYLFYRNEKLYALEDILEENKEDADENIKG